MEETNRTQPLDPGPVWAHRPQGAPTRAELTAALQVCRKGPGRRIRQAAVILAGLLLLLAGSSAGYLMLFQGADYPLAALGLPLLGVLLIGGGLLSLGLQRRLRRQLTRCPQVTLYPEFAHFADPDDPWDLMVEDLRRVERMEGWIVLLWRTGDALTVLPLPDESCAGGGGALLDRLREAAPGAVFRSDTRRPRMPRRLLPGVVLAALLGLSWVWPVEALQGWTAYSNGRNATLYLRYDADTGQIIERATGQPFARPAAGPVNPRWLTDDCCAVTYPSTDGTLQVELLFPHPDKARRFDPDPPAGGWRELTFGDTPVTLYWDEEQSGYRLQTSEGEFFYGQWQDSEGLGLVLCDDSGLPQWVLAPTVMPWFDSQGTVTSCPALSLCPVSMEQTEPVALLSTEAPAGDNSGETTPPVFSDTIDVCVNSDGVFFTWDGGLTAQAALDARDCARCGITGEADLEPLVLRWDVASFLTQEDGQIWSHTSRDQGQSWQTDLLADFGGATPDYRCLGFTGQGIGYAALSGTGADGTRRVELYTGLHHGLGWEAIQVPRAADGLLRPLNGLIFYDGASAVATAPGDEGDPWPYVFVTMDCGDTWKQIDVPFAESGQTGATGLSELYFDGFDWQITFTQAPTGNRKIVFETATLTNTDWTCTEVHSLS